MFSSDAGHVHSTWPRAWLQQETQSPLLKDDAILTAGLISDQLLPLRWPTLTKSWPVQTTWSSWPADGSRPGHAAQTARGFLEAVSVYRQCNPEETLATGAE